MVGHALTASKICLYSDSAPFVSYLSQRFEFDPHARVQVRISLVYAFGTIDSWVSVTTCVVFVFTDLLSFPSRCRPSQRVPGQFPYVLCSKKRAGAIDRADLGYRLGYLHCLPRDCRVVCPWWFMPHGFLSRI